MFFIVPIFCFIWCYFHFIVVNALSVVEIIVYFLLLCFEKRPWYVMVWCPWYVWYKNPRNLKNWWLEFVFLFLSSSLGGSMLVLKTKAENFWKSLSTSCLHLLAIAPGVWVQRMWWMSLCVFISARVYSDKQSVFCNQCQPLMDTGPKHAWFPEPHWSPRGPRRQTTTEWVSPCLTHPTFHKPP